MKLPRAMALACLFALVGAACEVADPQPGERQVYPSAGIVKTLDNVQYGPAVSQVLDVYTPMVPNGGAVLWIHGGTWGDADSDPQSLATEEQNGMQPVVQDLSRRGWTIFSMRYAGTDEAIFPRQIQDVKLALRWVKSRAAEFSVSANAIVAMGWSSGGHLAALLDVSSGSLEPSAVSAELAGISSRPAAAVSISGVLDPPTFPYLVGINGGNAQGIADLIGCPDTPNLWQSCNPALLDSTRVANYADAADPPLYIAQGDRDGIVDPYWQSEVPYSQLMPVMGDGHVWLDRVDTGEPSLYGGEDPRNHTKATSYEINEAALLQFMNQYLPAVAPTPTLSQFVSLTPCRLGDTRTTHPFAGVAAGTYRVQVAGTCGVPTGATAVAVTVTAVRPSRTTTLSAYPAGSPTGLTLLTAAPLEVRANSAMIALSPSGAIDISGAATGGLVVDITGAFVRVVTATSGRYAPVTPSRVLDSREGSASPLPARTTTELDARPAGVPRSASAVAVNLTITQTGGSGFLTGMAAGSPLPLTSALNVDAAGQTRAGFVVLPLNDGEFSVFNSVGAHVVVDVVGYFTGAGAARSQIGLYQVLRAGRAFETLSGAPMQASVARTALLGSSRASAVAANVTMMWAGSGYTTLWPTGTSRTITASVNADPSGRAVANQAFVGLSGGTAQVLTTSSAHLTIDVNGWFVGS